LEIIAAADFDGYTHMRKAILMPNPRGWTLRKRWGFKWQWL